MRIVIDEITLIGKDIFIKALTDIGNVSGKWIYREKPKKGGVYHVEYNISDLADDQISVLDDNKFKICCLSDNTVMFCGVCENIEEDFDDNGNSLGKIYYIRFAADGLFMADTETEKIKIGDTIAFTVSKNQVTIYPYD